MLITLKDPVRTEIRCELSKHLPIAQMEVDLFRYHLTALPTKYGENQEAILAFDDQVKGGYSNPQHEGELALALISLFFDCKISKTGYRANSLDMSRDKRDAFDNFFCGEIAGADYAQLIKNVLCLGDQLTKQFIRACNAYSLAIQASSVDRTLAFLLLVTSVECLSSQEEFIPNSELNRSSKSTERYCKFVKQYCSSVQDLYRNGDEEAFTVDLKTVYYSHRSAFVHGGAEVSIASEVADKTGFNHIGHFVDGKEIYTPGLKWFFTVVRRSLLGFLEHHPAKEPINEEAMAEIAKSKSVLIMRVADK
jgi:hypothetical protein